MYETKANILFILKIATELMNNGDNLNIKYYKEIFRAFKRFNETNEHYYYKVYLSEIDLERFNLKYLFFKNDLQELETKFEVLRIGDLFKEHELFHDYKKARTFDDVILFKRFLDTDKLYNVVYVNKRQYKFLKDLEARNKLKWYSIKDNEEEYEIVKKGNWSVRSNHNRRWIIIEDEEDILNLTLKDILSLIPIKYKCYGFNGMYGTLETPTIKEKINELINETEKRVLWNNQDINLKFLFVEHLRNILYDLFQSNEEEETLIEDYKPQKEEEYYK